MVIKIPIYNQLLNRAVVDSESTNNQAKEKFLSKKQATTNNLLILSNHQKLKGNKLNMQTSYLLR